MDIVLVHGGSHHEQARHRRDDPNPTSTGRVHDSRRTR
jgi:hypothetical protein